VVLPQLPIDGATVAAIDGSPVLERVQLIVGVVMCVRVVDEGQEALDHVEWGIVLAQGQKVVGTVALLRRCGTSASDTDGIVLAWH
jgi:hypothetical protein